MNSFDPEQSLITRDFQTQAEEESSSSSGGCCTLCVSAKNNMMKVKLIGF